MTRQARWIVHGSMLLLTLAVVSITAILKPTLAPVHLAAIAAGYASLIMLCLTLMIGTYNLWQKRIRRNPVNLSSRRTIGVWAAWIGVIHVVTGFQVHLGGRVLAYFFEENGALRTDLFGASNITGLIAALILIGLLALSNDLTLRWLKGKRWKTLQRLNYALFILVITHTIGYQVVVRREEVMTWTVIATVGVVLVAQAVGLWWMRARRTHAPGQ